MWSIIEYARASLGPHLLAVMRLFGHQLYALETMFKRLLKQIFRPLSGLSKTGLEPEPPSGRLP